MTNGKPPFDSDPAPEKTVIRPNPGGRRNMPADQQQTSSPSAEPGRVAAQDIWGGTRQAPGAQPPQPAPGAQRLQSAAATGPVIDLSAIGAASLGGPNPILDAAMPLLLLLANVRIARAVPQIAPMMGTVAQGIETLEVTLRSKSIPEDHIRTAKYALCATADDIVQNLPSSDRLLWTQYSMLSRFFQTRDSGIGFFDELAKLRQNPQVNHHLLGLAHACMSLGFEGKYRVAGGDIPHQQIRRDIYQTLRAREPRAGEELSPHWRGQNILAAHVRRAVPLWAVASTAAGLLLLSFMAFRWLLGDLTDIAEAKLASLHPATDINIFRVAPAPPPPPAVVPQSTQLERIRKRLTAEIAAKKLSADYAGKDIVVRLLNDSVFDKGSAKVRQGFVSAIGHVAEALNPEKGEIRVVGHTDNTPIRSSVRFKDNQDLSEQRAQAVALILVSGVSDPRRLKTSGLADMAPLDTANTPEAKARNRRVEVFIPREDM
jgi:type VI secretion system protein ImpK